MSVASEPTLEPFHAHPLPDTEAPRVDPATLANGRGRDPRQGTLSLVRHEPGARVILRPLPPLAPDDFGPRRTPTVELPEPRAWAAGMAATMLQVATGSRPPTQVIRHTAHDVYDSLVRRHGIAVRRGTGSRRPIRPRRVLVCHPCDGSVEATVIVDDGHRTRALALRLDGCDGRWVVSALRIG